MLTQTIMWVPLLLTFQQFVVCVCFFNRCCEGEAMQSWLTAALTAIIHGCGVWPIDFHLNSIKALRAIQTTEGGPLNHFRLSRVQFTGLRSLSAVMLTRLPRAITSATDNQ